MKFIGQTRILRNAIFDDFQKNFSKSTEKFKYQNFKKNSEDFLFRFSSPRFNFENSMTKKFSINFPII